MTTFIPFTQQAPWRASAQRHRISHHVIELGFNFTVREKVDFFIRKSIAAST